ncbi:sigma-70 family RNA polymerase sigma factor [Fredinandcohnia sp. 179-A 10B2 NHS]|uniref:sigma-70 family RNA polymerase sigma factor n=1 Tax=Fredinandcohnia sp. 179-A 10B2 NHS TaxID=3235176 RepID=UPI0039A0847D
MQVPFETLEKQYKPLIYQIIKSLHLYGDKDQFYQIGLIGLWEASTRFKAEEGAKFSTYAFTIIRGKLMDHIRRENHYVEVCETFGKEGDMNLTIEVDFEGSMLIEMYCRELTLNQKRWVLGRIIQDKSNKEIAEEHGVSVEAVKSWGKTAMKKLREIVVEVE